MECQNSSTETAELKDFITSQGPLLVLTGAGCSLASGIPTYRDRNGAWKRTDPIQHQDFVQSEAARQRCWTRSFAGWPAVAAAEPNAAHYALASLEEAGLIKLLVTQNVDRLHQKAGQKRVVDLHGRLDQVCCLSCEATFSREAIQTTMININPHLALSAPGTLQPDGDADVPDELINEVKIPACDHCGGILKPDVVFYGGSVKRQIVQEIYQLIDSRTIKGLLVVGSSLMVFSGYRFCRRAYENGVPIAILNDGKTRADDLMLLKLEANCTDILPAVIGDISI